MFSSFFEALHAGRSLRVPTPAEALPGRASSAFPVGVHALNGRPLRPPFPEGSRWLIAGMGCFWGAERRLWQQPGALVTAAGYAGGSTPFPTYKEVCSGQTGHTEVVLVVYDPAQTALDDLLTVILEAHDPTAGMRQGNDVGTQYRSALFPPAEDLERCAARLADYGARLAARGLGPITTELRAGGPPDAFFYYAEPEHQQYLHKNPGGYCGLRGTGVRCAG
jgi:peptide-methionine (S)-S-oxide reductase